MLSSGLQTAWCFSHFKYMYPTVNVVQYSECRVILRRLHTGHYWLYTHMDYKFKLLISPVCPCSKKDNVHCLLGIVHNIANVCLFVGCLMSQQHASLSQGRICSDNFTCCHTEIEVEDQTFHLTQSQFTDTWLTSPRADPIMPGA